MRLFILVLFTTLYSINAQSQTVMQMADMPEAIANNAVVGYESGGQKYVYSFTGIDPTKVYSGINLKSFKYDVLADSWTTLADVPDAMGGKIAAGASVVKDKIYVIGGYHVAASGNEISSAKTHVFDPATDTFEADGADILTPIDDHIQCVWRDSLIFVVTGWSNTTNVDKVQVYNPSDDTWAYGTSTPNNNNYKVFGGSGSIIGDTIYYIGGARYAASFPATNVLRKGVINPDNPLEITWSSYGLLDAKDYRAASVTYEDNVYWLGGSHTTYNYNGIAYNGTGGVLSNQLIKSLGPDFTSLQLHPDIMPTIMDLRGAAVFENGDVFIAGGMDDPQTVTPKTYKISLAQIINTNEVVFDDLATIGPNPNQGILNISPKFEASFALEIFNLKGQSVFLRKELKGPQNYSLDLESGYYIVQMTTGDKVSQKKIIIQR